MKKTWIIIAAALMVAGTLIFVGVMNMLNWDFSKLSTSRFVTNSYEISEEFFGIGIETDTARVTFAVTDGAPRVECREEEHASHAVSVQEGVLTIKLQSRKKWYHHIGINFSAPKVTVYLPEGTYGALKIKSSTGKIDIPGSFTFDGMDISLSTGDVTTGAYVKGDMKIKTSTGHITVTDVVCDGKMILKVSSGKTRLTNVHCGDLESTGNTGEVIMRSVLVTKGISMKRSTGDVTLEGCDASEIHITTNTGDVTGSLQTEKVFVTKTSTGRIQVPESTTGGKCKITTNTGNIKITID